MATAKNVLDKIREAKEKQLKELNLSKQKLDKIPEEILELEQIESINLSWNQIKEIPKEILELKKLKVLNLIGNRTIEIYKIINLSSLSFLGFSCNSTTKLPTWIDSIKELGIDIGNNQLTEIPEFISNLTNLTQLYLGNNRLTKIPEFISNLIELKNLNLSNNQLIEIPESIGDLIELNQLNLSNNQLIEIPESIGDLIRLKNLNLSQNRLTKILESIGDLIRLKNLNLSNNQLKSIPESTSNLIHLKNLDLNNNQLTEIPDTISNLSSLLKLNLSSNKITEIPNTITILSSLSQLHLSNNQLTEIPISISNLSSLTDLNLSGNKITEIPDTISNLSSLSQLYLSNNQLTEIPISINNLSNLTDLNLSNNQLTEIPDTISNLSSLSQLCLSNNQLTEISDAISNLSSLVKLNLSNNQLTEIPDSISNAKNLNNLDLSKNLLEKISESVTKLKMLSYLNLNHNRELTKIPESIGDLANLTQLHLRNNQLKKIPISVTKLTKLTNLDLKHTPLEPPPEIVVKGIESIKNYLRQLDEGQYYIYEAKLLILGEGGVGKTTLAKKIENKKYELPIEENSTEGIDIIKWHFLLDKDREFRVNIWDFGGQEIYHATHQFFLTKRSVYALVADTRKEDTDFYYWLNIVELLSDNSPLLIIKNEKQDRHRDINARALRGQFKNFKEMPLATNLATNRGLDHIITNIQDQIKKLPHIGQALPKTWVKVRKALENDSRNYISLNEYLYICEANGLSECSDKLQLSEYLHDLGVCLHFQDKESSLLYKIVILKPEWGTDAVYKVLDNPQVIEDQGHFNSNDLKNIWHEDKYASMRGELLGLMKKFQLCYEIPGQENYFIAPQLLAENQPEYIWDESNNLILRYSKYDFMPKGIITRFIVIMHRWIEQQQYVWKSGVILHHEDTKAEVIEYYGKREIKIRVSGEHKRDLLNNVIYELDKIHESYNRLKYSKLIPCNCSTCKNSQNPHFYDFKKLQEWRVNGRQTTRCDNKPYDTVNIASLIDDVIQIYRPDKPELNAFSTQKKESERIIIKNIINNTNELKNIGNKIDQSRKVNITGGNINASGAGSFSMGDISDTVANTINQLPTSTDSNQPEITELLEKLLKAIDAETELDDLDKSDALEEIQNLAEASQSEDQKAKTTIVAKSVRRLGRIANDLPDNSTLGNVSKKVLPAIAKLFESRS